MFFGEAEIGEKQYEKECLISTLPGEEIFISGNIHFEESKVILNKETPNSSKGE